MNAKLTWDFGRVNKIRAYIVYKYMLKRWLAKRTKNTYDAREDEELNII